MHYSSKSTTDKNLCYTDLCRYLENINWFGVCLLMQLSMTHQCSGVGVPRWHEAVVLMQQLGNVVTLAEIQLKPPLSLYYHLNIRNYYAVLIL